MHWLWNIKLRRHDLLVGDQTVPCKQQGRTTVLHTCSENLPISIAGDQSPTVTQVVVELSDCPKTDGAQGQTDCHTWGTRDFIMATFPWFSWTLSLLVNWRILFPFGSLKTHWNWFAEYLHMQTHQLRSLRMQTNDEAGLRTDATRTVSDTWYEYEDTGVPDSVHKILEGEVADRLFRACSVIYQSWNWLWPLV